MARTQCSHDITGNQISCITAPNMLAASARISRLTLTIDNSTHYLPYPFTYQPDPIITAIEPAESFVSGGRLVMVQGNYLSSPQTIQLLVYNEHKHNIINGTACIKQNDTLVTCLTPAISAELIDSLAASGPQSSFNSPQTAYDAADLLPSELNDLAMTGTLGSSSSNNNSRRLRATSYEMGGLKLKMMLIMDDVRSVRNLDEYYHHLPHYLTYFDDPKLYPLQNTVVDYTDELVIFGENLRMKQLDQDMLVTIGSQSTCAIKIVLPEQIVCEPPAKIAPVYDAQTGQLIDRPLLPVVVLIGAHLRFQVGLMQYSSSQYLSAPINNPSRFIDQQRLLQPPSSINTIYGLQHNSLRNMMLPSSGDSSSQMSQEITDSNNNASSVLAYLLAILSVVGFVTGFAVTFMFALSRFRQSKADREYKRIQLQMGSLDINGQPQLHHQHHFGAGLFDKIHFNGTAISSNGNHHQSAGINNNTIGLLSSLPSQHSYQQQHTSTNNQSAISNHSVKSRAIDYVGNALLGKTKLFQKFNRQSTTTTSSHLPSFPPSPMTDVSSLVGSSPAQKHLVRLGSNGNVINSTVPALQQYKNTIHRQQQVQLYSNNQPIYGATSSNDSTQSSPNSSSRHSNYNRQQQLYRDQRANNNETVIHSNPLVSSLNNANQQQQAAQLIDGSSRNFNWTQEAPSTIVPYAVIEACNLPLDNGNSCKKFNQI